MINIGLERLSPPQWPKVGRGQSNSRYNKKQTFVMLNGSWTLRMLGVDWDESVQKGKIREKCFFSDSVERNSKKL